jgi:hypothetical protein
MNLAGAVGVKCFGLFNKYPNYRWFDLTKSDVLWYKSVRPFVVDKENDWGNLMLKVSDAVKSELLQKK